MDDEDGDVEMADYETDFSDALMVLDFGRVINLT
jgi:hypothetical protein